MWKEHETLIREVYFGVKSSKGRKTEKPLDIKLKGKNSQRIYKGVIVNARKVLLTLQGYFTNQLKIGSSGSWVTYETYGSMKSMRRFMRSMRSMRSSMRWHIY